DHPTLHSFPTRRSSDLLQNFLWQGLIKTPEGYYAGYFNPWRGQVPFDTFLYYERDLESEMELKGFEQYKGLRKFSSGYDWLVQRSEEHTSELQSRENLV